MQAVLINHDTDLLDLTVADRPSHASVIHTRAKHPIRDQSARRWVRAAQLPRGYLLRAANGQALRVLKLATPRVASGDMWDLTVATDHDFYVAAGASAVLVQNCPMLGEGGTQTTSSTLHTTV